MMKRLLMVGGLFATLTMANAQEAFPEGDLLWPLADNSNWQVTFVYTIPSERGAPARPAKLTLTKTAPLWRAELTDTNGGRREAWGDGLNVYVMDGETPLIADQDGSSGSDEWLNSGAGKFPGFEWIGRSNFKGRQQWEGMTCLFFEQGGANGAMAWIEESSRTPVRWVRSGEFRTFTLLAPPTTPLTLPESIVELSAEMKKNHENNFRRAPRRSWQK